jgi:hypothetical protein
VFEGEHSVFLRMPLLPWVAPQALPHGVLTKNASKHTYIGHSLPDFYLQNTCKFATQSAVRLTALATCAIRKDARVLKPLGPRVLQSAACDVRIA